MCLFHAQISLQIPAFLADFKQVFPYILERKRTFFRICAGVKFQFICAIAYDWRVVILIHKIIKNSNTAGVSKPPKGFGLLNS